MPDRSDVEQALATLLAGILYPNGFDADSVTGDPFRVYRGWPVAGAFESDVMQGVGHVCVQPVPGSVRDTTRYSAEWQGARLPATLSVNVQGDSVTFSGHGGAGQVAGVRVDGYSYVYRMRDGDSAALVAAALAAQVRANRPAVAIGGNVVMLAARGVLGRVVTDGAGGRELRRQVAGFRITCWLPSPSRRDAVVRLVDTALAGRSFIDVGDWACRLRLVGDTSSDESSAGGIWRRDLLYSVEYPTVAEEILPAMLFGIADVNGSSLVG